MADNTNERSVQQFIDKLADAAIGMRMVNRLPSICTTRIQQEILNNVASLECWELIEYRTGSHYEGMPSDICGDRDCMTSHKLFPIILLQSPKTEETYKRGYLIAEQVDEPAFLRLKAVQKENYIVGVKSQIDDEGYLKAAGFAEVNNPHPESKSEAHGPALQHKVRRDDVDMVICLNCPSWPTNAEGYFSRERPNKWPSQILLAKVLSLGCLAVPVGHPNSSSKDIEWRWSFSVAERELIHDMCEPYAKCMFTLKSLKNMYIKYSDSEKPTPFCSYFIKTACLWMCEIFPHKDYSIVDLITKILDWLINCYQQKNMPHYFIPQQNLIGHLSRKHCDGVIAKLTEVKRGLWNKVMSSIHDDGQPFTLEVVNNMCDSLKITRINGSDDYARFQTDLLLNYHRSPEVLEEYISLLLPGGSTYNKFRYLNTVKQAETEMVNVFNVVEELKSREVRSAAMILRIPEEIVLPIIDKISDIVPEEYCEMFAKCLYRTLGDVYMYLMIFFDNFYVSPDLLASYENKPIYYYDRGAGMVFPDKWSGDCIGRLARVSRYEYFMGNHGALKDILAFYQPLLCKIIDSEEILNRQMNMCFSTSISLVMNAWGIDEEVQSVAKNSPWGVIFLHPVVLLFYIQARVALKYGDTEKACESMKHMERCKHRILLLEVKRTTKALIDIIYKEILEILTKMLENCFRNYEY